MRSEICSRKNYLGVSAADAAFISECPTMAYHDAATVASLISYEDVPAEFIGNFFRILFASPAG